MPPPPLLPFLPPVGQAILEAITRVEAAGYAELGAMGGSPLRRVLTAGGGSANPAWTEMRRRKLGVPVTRAPSAEAAFGLATLAGWGAGGSGGAGSGAGMDDAE